MVRRQGSGVTQRELAVRHEMVEASSVVAGLSGPSVLNSGRKQVTKRSTHARPGMHMQQCGGSSISSSPI